MNNKPRGVLIAGNWKMNHTMAETASFFGALTVGTGGRPPLDPASRTALKSGKLGAVVFPSTISLAHAHASAERAAFAVEIGAQNVHWEKKGAYTGEISGPMIAELGLRWVLVGHSERRQFSGETDETVRKRAESLLAQGFQTMICVGETRAEREAGQTEAVLSRQMAGGLSDAMAQYLDGRLVLAYEPVWAIGTGLTATPDQAQDAHSVLRKLLHGRFGGPAAAETPILYGGSVTPENVDELLACADVDGALVGGASLRPESFLALLSAGGRAVNG